ncbi:hypothetical protein NBRC3188_1462 [Acetobacter pasteurianus NBRC 3188]|uniref:Uncharacterized protein n=1 Tax=Acetobacter pasteurianus NBRC 3188 TaxID=1226663 RepID=A0A401WTY7_ACEPA|nr:hypothetical protein NBRC3188_1462 [Acetobacter pasteurianus NBRC 3188]
MRICTGWLQEYSASGNSRRSVSSIAATNPACVRAVFHVDGELRRIKLSVSFTPIGSVGMADVPVLLTTVLTSGKRRKICSCFVTDASTVSRDAEGRRVVVTAKAPSSSWGMNSPPRRVARPTDNTRTTSVPPNRSRGCASPHSVRCAYGARRRAISHVSPFGRTRARVRAAITGIQMKQ